jgi:hypothetical protein
LTLILQPAPFIRPPGKGQNLGGSYFHVKHINCR